MSLLKLQALLIDLATRIQSPEFLVAARHPDHPTAFTRRRKLPLVSLVVLMISGMRKSIQAELDEFFAHLQKQAHLVRRFRARVRESASQAFLDSDTGAQRLADPAR